MASETQVKQYLSEWFQLGKKLIINHESQLPQPLFEGSHYSRTFETCWQTIFCSQLSHKAYLEGTQISIGDLLNDAWELHPCPRCAMPIPLPTAGIGSTTCPCHDLPSWPNTELPRPRQPIDTQVSLGDICRRLVSN